MKTLRFKTFAWRFLCLLTAVLRSDVHPVARAVPIEKFGVEPQLKEAGGAERRDIRRGITSTEPLRFFGATSFNTVTATVQ